VGWGKEDVGIEFETSLYRKLCATKMRYVERIPKDFGVKHF